MTSAEVGAGAVWSWLGGAALYLGDLARELHVRAGRSFRPAFLVRGGTRGPTETAREGNPGPQEGGPLEEGVAVGGLTNQNEDADQEGDEGARAEGGGHDEGRGVAGLDGARAVAAADADGEGARAAQRGRPAVHHQDGQEEHVLLLPVEAQVLGVHRGCVVCSRTREARVIWGPGPPSPAPATSHFHLGICISVSQAAASPLTYGPVPRYPKTLSAAVSDFRRQLPDSSHGARRPALSCPRILPAV